MNKTTILSLFVVCLLPILPVSGQVASASSTDQSVPTFRQEQLALLQEYNALVAGGATPQQLQAWQTQNAARFSAFQQLAVQQGAVSAAKMQPVITDITIPIGASKDLEDLMVTQATLVNGAAQIHNANLSANQTASPDSSNLSEAQALHSFTSQNATVMQAQADRIERVSGGVTATAQPVPGPLSLPANIGPEMKAFLTLRDQLMREQVAIWNQNLTTDLNAKSAILAKWSQQNSVRLQQLQTLALAIPAAPPPTSTSP